jgi:hypothetical protein
MQHGKKSTSPQPMRVGTHHPQQTKIDFLPPELCKTGQITPEAVLKNHSKSQKNHKMKIKLCWTSN